MSDLCALFAALSKQAGLLEVRRSALVALLLLSGCASLPVPGASDSLLVAPLSAEESRDHLDRGARLMRTGSFVEAAEHFERVLGGAELSRSHQVLALAGLFTSWHLKGDRVEERRAARRFFQPQFASLQSGDSTLPASAASEIRWLRHVALRVVAAADAETKRRVAASARNPIPLLAPSEAGETLGWIACGRDGEGYYMIESDEDRRVGGVEYNVLGARCSQGGRTRSFWFDLSLWYAFTATHLEGASPPIGFSRDDAARVVGQEFAAGGR